MGPHDLLDPLALDLRDAALALVHDERGVRVEDYLTALAAATGEAAIASSGIFDIEANDLPPGSAVFGDPINEVLTGDVVVLEQVPPGSVVGVLRDRLVPATVEADAFGSIEERYGHVAEAVGAVPWGQVAVRVPSEHQPTVLPLQMAFELRPTVRAVVARAERFLDESGTPRPAGWGPHVLCALALASAVAQTAAALDPVIAVALALDVTFGMAKTVPMSQAAFEAARHDP